MNLGKLDSLERRLGAKDEVEIAEEVEALRLELSTFRREHTDFRELAHAAVDATVAEAAGLAAQILDSIAIIRGPVAIRRWPNSPEPPALHAARLLSLTRPEFAKAWHAAVDRAEGFSELTKAEFDKREAKLEAEIRSREVELDRRRIVATRVEADQELASLEKRL